MPSSSAATMFGGVDDVDHYSSNASSSKRPRFDYAATPEPDPRSQCEPAYDFGFLRTPYADSSAASATLNGVSPLDESHGQSYGVGSARTTTLTGASSLREVYDQPYSLGATPTTNLKGASPLYEPHGLSYGLGSAHLTAGAGFPIQKQSQSIGPAAPEAQATAALPKTVKPVAHDHRPAFKSHEGSSSASAPTILQDPEAGKEGLQVRNAPVIDLTEDDDDVVMVSQSVKPQPLVRRNQVIFGTLRSVTIESYRVPIPEIGSGNSQNWPAIPITIVRDPSAVTARDAYGGPFGIIVGGPGQVLADLLKLGTICLQAYTYPRHRHSQEQPGQTVQKLDPSHPDAGREPGRYIQCYINIYGPEAEVKRVAVLASQQNIFLQSPLPSRYDQVMYINPHLATQQIHAPRPPADAGYISRTVDEIRSDVNKVFDNLHQAESLPEMKPDPRIKTPLIAHQKQGLYFMMKKEEPRTFEDDEEDNRSLWRKKDAPDGRTGYYHVITGQYTVKRPLDILGGMLADMMGLGKTLQILSLVVSTLDAAQGFSKTRKPYQHKVGPTEPNPPTMKSKATLLVCPLSTVGNWEEQIAAHVVPGALKYYIYHGTKRQSDAKALAEYDIILTTYQVIANEYSKHVKDKDKFMSPLQQTLFFRIALDEAHIIREQATLQSRAVTALHAQRRWAVTGTPVQNRLDDLAALLKFLRVKPFDEKLTFNQYIAVPFKKADEDAVGRLRLIVDSITLRRLKDRIDLPSREDMLIELDFNSSEKQVYEAAAKQSSARIDMVARSGHVGGKNYVHVLQMILRLRMICAHGRELLGEDDTAALAGLTSNDAIDVDALEEKSSSISAKQAYEILSLMKETGEDMCTQCNKKAVYKDTVMLSDEAEKSESEKEKSKDVPKSTTIGYLTPCAHLLCNDCLPIYQSTISKDFKPEMQAKCHICGLYNRISLFEFTSNEYADFELRKNDKGPKKKQIQYRGPSPKVRALIEALLENRMESTPEDPVKSVVFSCWTTHMDLIEVAFKNKDIRFVRLDGKMSRPARNQAIQTFRDDPAVEVILVSLMAGGLGLNLTAACRVYMMEPQFNPAAEAQAIDRIHRLGQKRSVKCVRYVMRNSFEGKILELQQKKNDLANMTLQGGRKLTRSEATWERLKNLQSLFK